MEYLEIKTHNVFERNVEIIRYYFPNCVSETKSSSGEIMCEVDFERLKQELFEEYNSIYDERYSFTWPDKKLAIQMSNSPTTSTLRPVREESLDFDHTGNLYIEGDNLEVLKILREDYLGKVQMIYIDPPYNTGQDFIYRDNYSRTVHEYIDNSGQIDNEGNRMVTNLESNGRFHTDWLNMMYPRLRVAKDLLTEYGVICISIDDNEVHNLRKICDEIFGERNFVAQCVRKRRDSQANLSKNISPIHEYIVIYTRNQGDVLNKVAAKIDVNDYKNPDNDPRGPYKTMPCTNKGGKVYSVVTPTGAVITEEWRFKRETYESLLNDNRIVFPKAGEGKPRYKLFLSEKQEEGVLANTWLDMTPSNQEATREIKDLFDDLVFDTPKPVGLIQHCLQLASHKDSIIVDFFSGSATTAHAVMKQNAEDGGSRKFILVQMPERLHTNNVILLEKYSNICEIGKERIRRAGQKILTEVLSGRGCLDGTGYGVGMDNYEEYVKATGDRVLDIGFRVLKLDSANEKEVKCTPSEVPVEQGLFDAMLDDMVENIKEDRTPEDLLFQVLPMCNLPLSCKIETKEIDGKCVFIVEDGYLIACFDDEINENVITAIAKMKPYYFVMRDSSLATDNVADNFDQIFNAYSKDTIRRIL